MRRTSFSALDRFDAIAAGADDRLDELAVGILVAAIDELCDGMNAIRPFVEDAAEVERPQGIVDGTNHVEAGNAPREMLEGVAQTRGLERSELFTGTPLRVDASGAQLVRVRRRRRRGDEDNLFSARGG